MKMLEAIARGTGVLGSVQFGEDHVRPAWMYYA